MTHIADDITGQKYNRLLAIEFSRPSDSPRSRASYWWFRCDCGTLKEMQRNIVTRPRHPVKSCGCAKRNPDRRRSPVPKDHYLYRLWNGIKNRTGVSSNRQWESYGGRGITMHPAWRTDFGRFMSDILEECGERPAGRYANGTSKYSLDRIDNDSGYQPGNVRWATRSEQRRNQRSVDELSARIIDLEQEIAELRKRLT